MSMLIYKRKNLEEAHISIDATINKKQFKELIETTIEDLKDVLKENEDDFDD